MFRIGDQVRIKLGTKTLPSSIKPGDIGEVADIRITSRMVGIKFPKMSTNLMFYFNEVELYANAPIITKSLLFKVGDKVEFIDPSMKGEATITRYDPFAFYAYDIVWDTGNYAGVSAQYTNDFFEAHFQLVKQTALPYNGPLFGIDPSAPYCPIDSGCSHEWKRYKGFTEEYVYCTKCDEKQKD